MKELLCTKDNLEKAVIIDIDVAVEASPRTAFILGVIQKWETISPSKISRITRISRSTVYLSIKWLKENGYVDEKVK